MVIGVVAFIIMASQAGRISARVGAPRAVQLGSGVQLVACLVMLVLGQPLELPFGAFAVFWFIFCGALAVRGPAAFSEALKVPASQLGRASAMLVLMILLAGAIGTQLVAPFMDGRSSSGLLFGLVIPCAVSMALVVRIPHRQQAKCAVGMATVASLQEPAGPEQTVHQPTRIGGGMRLLLFVALLAGCETTRTSITRPVVTLGYDHPPSVVVFTRGDAEAVEHWAASLRTEKTIAIVAELQEEKVEPLRSEAKFLCSKVREQFPDQLVDEIVVLDVEKNPTPIYECVRTVCQRSEFLPKNTDPDECGCVLFEYRKFITSYKTRVSSIRASSCLLVATEELPAVIGESNPRPPTEFITLSEVAGILETDGADAMRAAVAALVRTVEAHRWQLFPAFDAIVRALDKQTVEVLDPKKRLESGRTYWIKRPAGAMRETAYVSKVGSASATVRTTKRPVEARDELHETTEVRRVMMYGGLSGGTVRAETGRHGTAAAALAARISFKVLPMVFEVRLDGDLVPGLDTARWAFSGAGGFRYQLGPIAPLVFAELGLAMAYQPDATSAVGFQGGLGAGVELSLGRWALLLDVRYRGFYLDDWKKADKVVEATSPYDSWRSTTLQLGVGALF